MEERNLRKQKVKAEQLSLFGLYHSHLQAATAQHLRGKSQKEFSSPGKESGRRHHSCHCREDPFRFNGGNQRNWDIQMLETRKGGSFPNQPHNSSHTSHQLERLFSRREEKPWLVWLSWMSSSAGKGGTSWFFSQSGHISWLRVRSLVAMRMESNP